MPKKVTITKSPIHGNGVFAKYKIKKGETAFIIKGKFVKWSVTNQKESFYGPDWIGISDNTWIDPQGAAKFINHSCDPSCGIKGRLKVVALRDIQKGEELTVDYSITEIDKLWYMKCHCGAKNCRKRIHSIQFLPKKLYNRYIPYIPTYFKKVYTESANAK